jgi:hypothetical protein
MKSEQEFLEGMWSKVLKIEYEELQKSKAKKESKKAIRKAIYVHVLLILSFSCMGILLYFNILEVIEDFIYLFLFGILGIGYFIESKIAGN